MGSLSRTDRCNVRRRLETECSDSWRLPSRSLPPTKNISRASTNKTSRQLRLAEDSSSDTYSTHGYSRVPPLSMSGALSSVELLGCMTTTAATIDPCRHTVHTRMEQALSVPSSRVSPILRMLPKQRRFISQGPWWSVLTSAYVSC